MIDLLVAGAGPAGLATALYAARAGLDVTVVDPRFAGSAKPIDKACGEGLMPGAVAALGELGVDPPGRDFRGIGYVAAVQRAVSCCIGDGDAAVSESEPGGLTQPLGRHRLLVTLGA